MISSLESEQNVTYFLGDFQIQGKQATSFDDLPMLTAIISAGIPAKNARILRGRISHQVFDLVIPRTTLASKRSQGRLSLEQSDRLVRVGRVYARAAEVFGDRERGRMWLERPNSALDGKAPAQLLTHDPGVRQIEQMLGRIEHGIAA